MRALTVKGMDETLLRQIKVAAAASGKTMHDWISDALRAALPKKGKAGA